MRGLAPRREAPGGSLCKPGRVRTWDEGTLSLGAGGRGGGALASHRARKKRENGSPSTRPIVSHPSPWVRGGRRHKLECEGFLKRVPLERVSNTSYGLWSLEWLIASLIVMTEPQRSGTTKRIEQIVMPREAPQAGKTSWRRTRF